MKRHAWFLIVLLLAACDHDRQQTPATTMQHSEKAASVRERLAPLDQPIPATEAGGAFSVTLVPEQPRTGDTLEVQATDCREKLSYAWDVNGVPVKGQHGPALPSSFFARGDQVTVTGNCSDTESQDSIVIGNTPPAVKAIQFKGPQFGTGIAIEAEVTGEDADGDAVEFTYQWQIDGRDHPEVIGPILPGNLVVKGEDIVLTVTPSDPEEDGEAMTAPAYTVPDSPPKFTSAPPASFQGETYSYRPQVADPDGDPVTFALDTAPPGMTIDAHSGQINWPLPSQAGKFQVSITATDPDGMMGRQSFSITLN